jgi:glutamate dehydrogenase (NAD(P)+)
LLVDRESQAPAPSFHRITRNSTLLGYISVDSTIRGRSRGGLRLAPDLSEDEIRSASRAMTLKYGLLGLPQGGAKAGIIGDDEAPMSERRRMLLEFAHAARPLLADRRYIPDADLGTRAPEIRWMMEAIGMRVAPRAWRRNRSGEYTARSCLVCAQALLERSRSSLVGRRVAVEGFGNVGATLAHLLRRRGAVVVGISTSRGALYRAAGLDVERLARRAAQLGSRFVEDESDAIERSRLLELDVDLLCPCARRHSIHAGNVERVAARAICAGANDPVSPDAERALLDRGVPYPPDFVSNCGGVLGGTLEFAGVSFDRIGDFIDEHLRRRVTDLLDRADRLGVAPRHVAESDALERHARVRRAADHPGLFGVLRSVGLEAYRRRLVPRRPVSAIALRSVGRRMA